MNGYTVSLAFALLLACTTRAEPIFDFDHPWRYEQSGRLPALNWMQNTYDDSAWAEGRGLFGFPADEFLPVTNRMQTSLSLSDGTNVVMTYYFRTQFQWSGSTSNLVLIFTNVIDDGAVLYLNGHEIARPFMAAGVVSNSTRAVGLSPFEVYWNGPHRLMIPATHLVEGTNTLAVEVHQITTFSSDVVFGMQLAVRYMEPPRIVSDVEDIVSFCVGRPVAFSVRATGDDLSYIWHSNDVPVRLQTNAPVLLVQPSASNNGFNYRVAVSNALAIAWSRPALLTFVADSCGPRVRSAVSRDDRGQTNVILVSFDDMLMPATATNLANYSLQPTTGSRTIGLTNARPTGGAAVLLSASEPLLRSDSHVLTLNGITDIRSNTIAPNSKVAVRFTTSLTLVPTNALWTFRPGVPGCSAVQPDWNQAGFLPDATWQGPLPLPPDGQALSNCPVYYFRTEFVVSPVVTADRELTLNGSLNGGLVAYLNGTEFARLNMPVGPVSHWTLATNTSGFNIRANPANLVSGTNVLAISVHAIADPGLLEFNAQLDLQYFNGPTLPPPTASFLTLAHDSEGLLISWPPQATGFVLERTDTPGGPWREAQPFLSNPYRAPTNSVGFYRLKWEP